MIQNGTYRSEVDKRDYSFHRTFGTIAAPLAQMEYLNDAQLTMPDQNADGFPMGCTGYTQTDIAIDQDRVTYYHPYTYERTCFMEGHPTDRGCDIRTSAKCGQIYGMQVVGETEAEAKKRARGKFFHVDRVNGYDWFDSFRSALRRGQSISVGTPWFPEWQGIGQDGILTSLFVYDGTPSHYAWHNYKLCGEKIIDGQPYIVAKPWQGKGFGDNGWCYIGREAFNKAYDIYGTIGITQTKAKKEDIRTIQLTALQYVLIYFGRMLGLKAYA